MIKTIEDKTQEGLTNLVGTSKHTKIIYNVLKYSLLSLIVIYILVFLLKMF
jgi:hypothetical protein